MDPLTSLKIKGHIQQTKKKGSSIDALEVIFTGARIERGQCTIFFNERISWSFIAQYFTIPVSYTHLDVYKRQVQAKGSSGADKGRV